MPLRRSTNANIFLTPEEIRKGALLLLQILVFDRVQVVHSTAGAWHGIALALELDTGVEAVWETAFDPQVRFQTASLLFFVLIKDLSTDMAASAVMPCRPPAPIHHDGTLLGAPSSAVYIVNHRVRHSTPPTRLTRNWSGPCRHMFYLGT